jgi:hypothetical protein
MIVIYHAGIRLYYSLIPLFAWAMSSWVLLAVCPLYVLLMRDYDNNHFVEAELETMYKNTTFGRYKSVLERQESINDEAGVVSLSPSKSNEML